MAGSRDACPSARDLLDHMLISDPHLSKNARDSAWVGDRDWSYICFFPSPEHTDRPVFLHFKGLDTIATIYLNGEEIGEFNNMFREYSIEIHEKLAPSREKNVLLIIFSSPLRFISELEQPADHVGIIEKYKYLRKPNHDFKSYLGARPHSVKVGIYRDVVLDIPDRAWIEDVWVQTTVSKDLDHASLDISVHVEGEEANLDWKLEDSSQRQVAHGSSDTVSGEFKIELHRPKMVAMNPR